MSGLVHGDDDLRKRANIHRLNSDVIQFLYIVPRTRISAGRCMNTDESDLCYYTTSGARRWRDR